MIKYIAITVLLITCSCTWARPHPLFMATDVPGPPEYKKGWEHGCESGLATYGTVINKFSNKFYQDYRMMKDHYYDAGWHEGFDYCRHYNLKWQTQDHYQGIMN